MIAALPVSNPVSYFAETGPRTLEIPAVIEFESYSCYFNYSIP
jgi:hypothetical protein